LGFKLFILNPHEDLHLCQHVNWWCFSVQPLKVILKACFKRCCKIMSTCCKTFVQLTST
jgi:hypothetical protein